MAALRRWLLPMFIAVAGVPFTTANQMVSLDSKGMMKAPADGRAHGIYTAVPEISLLARGDIENRRMRTGGDSDDLEFSDNVYASADTGGSTWQAQIEDRQEARAQAIDVAKLRKQADAKARRDAAIRGEIRQQAELQEWQRRERAVGEEAEVAAQRAYAMGHDAEIAAKRAFLMSGGMHGDEWLQSERAEHSRTEHFGVGMHADERLLQAETAVHSSPQEMRVGGMHGLAGWSQEGINEKRALPPERHVRSARSIMRPLDGWSQEGMDDQRAPRQRARSAPSSNEVSHEEMDRQMAPPQHELDSSRNEWSQEGIDQQMASTQRARRPPIMRRAKASPNAEVDDLVRNQWWGHRQGPQNLEHAHEDGWVQASNSLDGEDAHMESNAGASLYGRGSLNDANSDALANSDVEAIPQQGPPGKLYSQGGPTLRSGLGEMERFRFQNEEAGKSYEQRKRSQISDGMDSIGSGSGSSLVANDAPTTAHAGISTGARPGFGDLQKQNPGSSAAMALTVNSADVTWNEEGQDHLGGSSDGTEGKTPQGGNAAHDDAEGVTDKGAEAMSAPPQWSHEERQATGASSSSFQSMPAIDSMHDQDIQAILRLQHVLTDEGVQAQSHGNENHAADFRTFANDADIRYGQPLHENDPEQRNAPTTQGYKLGGSDGWSGSSLPTTVSADYSSDGRSLLEVGEVKAPSPKTGGNEHTSQASIKQVEITSQADIQQVSRRGAKKATASSKHDQDPQNVARDRAVARAKAIVEAKAKAKPVTSANSMAKTKAKPKPCQGKAGCAVSKSKVQVFASGFAAPISKSDTKVKRAKAKAKLGAKATQASKAEKMAKQVAKAAQAKSQMLAKARNKVKEVAKAKNQAKKSAKKSPKKSVKKSVTKTKAKSRSTRR